MKAVIFLAILAVVSALHGQQVPPQPEDYNLQQELAEAGNSPIDIVRAIEKHLKEYPNTARKVELQRALAKTALDLNDDERIIQYGEPALASDPYNVPLLARVTASLVRKGDKASAERALEHARRYEQLIQEAYRTDRFGPGAGRVEAARKEEYDRGLASAKLLQARAQGLLGHTDQAIAIAKSSYDAYPSVESAREAARWLTAAGKDTDAIQYLANAFTIAGLRATDSDAANDRARMSDLYRKLNGSDTGLGDLVLKAYDDTSARFAARRGALREYEANSQTKDLMQFTLSGLDGDKLKLASLAGKVVVLDFWATWCIPCRAQHPLYEMAKANFKDTDDVVFLSINADEDKNPVKPFVTEQKWNQKIYFEDGLQTLLQVASIPTTIVLGRKGEVLSRMVGYIPDRFVEMLGERIDEALGRPHTAQPQKTMNGTIGNPSSQ